LRRSIAQGRVPNVAAALIGMAGLVIAAHGDQPLHRATVRAEASRRRPARHEAQCRACLRAALAPPVGTAAPHQHSEEAQCSVAT
ncbi:MAG: hypothetical protein ACO3CC_07325, partial [Alphaproteobacteria bacterium]